jgi:hypothetical protein
VLRPPGIRGALAFGEECDYNACMNTCNHRPRKNAGARPATAHLGLMLLVILATLFFSEPALARRVFGLVQGGATLQAGPASFREQWKTGLNIGGTVLIELGPDVSLGFGATYHNFPFDRSDLPPGSLRFGMFGASTRYTFMEPEDPYRPYIMIGYGIADVSLSGDRMDIVTIYDDDELHRFFAGGIGVQINLTDLVALMIEARYVGVDFDIADGHEFFPLTVGIKF